ncbi:uncharacterized protein PHACADRAFT_201658 [Phanerochaete carnosa HHB-10118-sp]|uniref:Uncharacterized protein n=1 Tax=Phanerochaete carnosa (strain HHB-10118-sp) TaxID=650164 RepID=K5VRM1_PHACS|nr:uncharacterized protein PHACADRAFT_201658 [Phanerochaete carnosa HHB-10118-sp]EKM49400.1 hypothetical protein PHACADRAFT_201658 [Phanerochaete carnosa HHB-10118-sp]
MPITHPSDGFGFGSGVHGTAPPPGSHGASLRRVLQLSDLRLPVSPQHNTSPRFARLGSPKP